MGSERVSCLFDSLPYDGIERVHVFNEWVSVALQRHGLMTPGHQHLQPGSQSGGKDLLGPLLATLGTCLMD